MLTKAANKLTKCFGHPTFIFSEQFIKYTREKKATVKKYITIDTKIIWIRVEL